MKMVRVVILWGISVALVIGFCAAPLPHFETFEGEVKPLRPILFFAPMDAKLTSIVKEGTFVKAGDTIAELAAESIKKDRMQVEQEREQIELRLRLIEDRASDEPELQGRIPAFQSRLKTLNRELDQIDDRIKSLVIVASESGCFYGSFKAISLVNRSGDLTLSQWQGRSTDKENLRAFFARGESIGFLVPPREMGVEIRIPETASNEIQVGSTVKICLHTDPRELYEAEIVEQSNELYTENQTGKAYSIAKCRLVEMEKMKLVNLTRATAHVKLENKTMLQQAARAFLQTFAIDGPN